MGDPHPCRRRRPPRRSMSPSVARRLTRVLQPQSRVFPCAGPHAVPHTHDLTGTPCHYKGTPVRTPPHPASPGPRGGWGEQPPPGPQAWASELFRPVAQLGGRGHPRAPYILSLKDPGHGDGGICPVTSPVIGRPGCGPDSCPEPASCLPAGRPSRGCARWPRRRGRGREAQNLPRESPGGSRSCSPGRARGRHSRVAPRTPRPTPATSPAWGLGTKRSAGSRSAAAAATAGELGRPLPVPSSSSSGVTPAPSHHALRQRRPPPPPPARPPGTRPARGL